MEIQLIASVLVVAGVLMILASPRRQGARSDILWVVGWCVFSVGFAAITLMLASWGMDMFDAASHPTPNPPAYLPIG